MIFFMAELYLLWPNNDKKSIIALLEVDMKQIIIDTVRLQE